MYTQYNEISKINRLLATAAKLQHRRAKSNQKIIAKQDMELFRTSQ